MWSTLCAEAGGALHQGWGISVSVVENGTHAGELLTKPGAVWDASTQKFRQAHPGPSCVAVASAILLNLPAGARPSPARAEMQCTRTLRQGIRGRQLHSAS